MFLGCLFLLFVVLAVVGPKGQASHRNYRITTRVQADPEFIVKRLGANNGTFLGSGALAENGRMSFSSQARSCCGKSGYSVSVFVSGPHGFGF